MLKIHFCTSKCSFLLKIDSLALWTDTLLEASSKTSNNSKCAILLVSSPIVTHYIVPFNLERLKLVSLPGYNPNILVFEFKIWLLYWLCESFHKMPYKNLKLRLCLGDVSSSKMIWSLKGVWDVREGSIGSLQEGCKQGSLSEGEVSVQLTSLY